MKTFFFKFELKYLSTIKGQIRYRIFGKGQILLMLHGKLQRHVMWHVVATSLVESFFNLNKDSIMSTVDWH